VQVMDENHRLIEVSALASVSVCTVFLWILPSRIPLNLMNTLSHIFFVCVKSG
jgi:hypothetical protein